jgi:hypothetical protein
MITSAATPSKCIASTLIVVDLQKIGKGILGYLLNKETKDPRSKDQATIITEEACQAKVTVEAEGHTPSNLHTACSTTVK